MLKRTLLTMTAISILTGPALHGTAMAGQFNKPIRMVGPSMKMRIDTRRLATRKDAKKAALPAVQSAAIQPPAEVMAGPQPEPPTRPKRTRVTNFAKPIPQPNPRPYNEFDDSGNSPDAGPATELPEEGKLFDEDLIAFLPETWGHFPIDILEGFGRGAIDGAFDNPPDPVGPFPPGDDRPVTWPATIREKPSSPVARTIPKRVARFRSSSAIRAVLRAAIRTRA